MRSVTSLFVRVVMRRSAPGSPSRCIDSRGTPKPHSTSGHTGTYSTYRPKVSVKNRSSLWPASYLTGFPSRQVLIPNLILSITVHVPLGHPETMVRAIINAEAAVWVGLVWTKGPGGVTLRPAGPRQGSLAFEFLDSKFLVFRARQRRQEGHEVIDVVLRQGKGLDIFVEPGVFQAVTLIVMVHGIPEGLLGAIVEVGRGHKHVTQVRGLEGSYIGLFPGDEKTAEHRQVRLNRRPVDCREIARLDEAYGLARQLDYVMPDDPDTDVVKIEVREVGGVHIHGGMAAVAVRPGVEKHPAALGGGVDSIPVARDESIEGRIKRDQSALICGDRARQIEGAGGFPEYLLEGLPVFADGGDFGGRGFTLG